MKETGARERERGGGVELFMTRLLLREMERAGMDRERGCVEGLYELQEV